MIKERRHTFPYDQALMVGNRICHHMLYIDHGYIEKLRSFLSLYQLLQVVQTRRLSAICCSSSYFFSCSNFTTTSATLPLITGPATFRMRFTTFSTAYITDVCLGHKNARMSREKRKLGRRRRTQWQNLVQTGRRNWGMQSRRSFDKPRSHQTDPSVVRALHRLSQQ